MIMQQDPFNTPPISPLTQNDAAKNQPLLPQQALSLTPKLNGDLEYSSDTTTESCDQSAK